MARRGMRVRPPTFRVNHSHPLAEGLVFAGLGQHPGSTHYHDGSAHGNHGTLTNMDPPTDWAWLPELGRHSTAHAGAGSGDIIQLRSPIVFPTSTAWAVSFWCDNTANYDYFGACGHLYTLGNYTRIMGSATGQMIIRDDANSGADMAGVWVTGNHHYAVSRTAANYTSAYRDGQLVGGPGAYPGVYTVFRLACYGEATAVADAINGLLADPMIYNRALSDAEIARHADPSNVDLDGMIQAIRPRRVFYAPTTGNRRRRLLLCGAAA